MPSLGRELPVQKLLILFLASMFCGGCEREPVAPTQVKEFKYTGRQLDNGKYEFVFQNAPENFVSLTSAPEKLEDKLKTGKWLVMLCARYSVLDIQALYSTARAVKGFERRVKVGIRPFWDEEENTKWFPQYREVQGFSPIYIFLNEGTVVSFTKVFEFFDANSKWSDKRFRDWLELQLNEKS